MKLILGVTAKDVVTGFKGIVTAHVEYLTGCTQYLVQPPVKKDGGYTDNKWFDEDRLEHVAAKAITLPRTLAGCDSPAPCK